ASAVYKTQGEALAAGAGDGDVAGEGDALAAGEGEVAGEGLAEAAGAGVGDWANAPERQRVTAAAGITAARKGRKKLVIACLPKASKALPAFLAPRARPGSRERAYLTRMAQIRPMTDAS
ncbi:hypothetical protein, partial [Bradyrhizobium sp. UFLA05-112]